jgi:hypothetical protein
MLSVNLDMAEADCLGFGGLHGLLRRDSKFVHIHGEKILTQKRWPPAFAGVTIPCNMSLPC